MRKLPLNLRKGRPACLPEADKKPRQGWKEQFDQAEPLQQQLSEKNQEWLDAPLKAEEKEEAW